MKQENIPYTYLIGWSEKNVWYYGVRYARNCSPADFWVKYFTSSKYVKDFVTENGQPDVIQIRKTFSSVKSAKDWEDKVLRRLTCAHDAKWLNKANLNAFKSVVMTDEIRGNIGTSKKRAAQKRGKTRIISDGINQTVIPENIPLPDGWYYGRSIKNAEIQKNAKHNRFDEKSDEEMLIIRDKISKGGKGKPKKDGHGENVSKATKGKPKPWQQGDNNVSKRPDVRAKISKSWESRVIGLWYTDEITNFYIKEGDYINPLWRRGKKKLKNATN